jgi:putative DNA primase/helicase
MQFLVEVFQADDETIISLQRLLGYTLTGWVTEEILVICFGFGSNGKSIFSNTVHRIFGGYAKTAPASLLASRRDDDSSPRNDLAAIAGARYVSINEYKAGARLDEQVVKQLAGREPIAARFLYHELFEYLPTFTAWLRTNYKPIVLGDDDGIWRRLVVVPFQRKFEESEKDEHLEEKLFAERDGILRWMLEGTRLYLKDGLRLSKTIKAEQAAYRKESDMLGEFLEEKTKLDPSGRAEQSAIFSSWKWWCEENGTRHGSKKSFTQRMAERGYPACQSNGNRYYTGLTLLGLFPSQGR